MFHHAYASWRSLIKYHYHFLNRFKFKFNSYNPSNLRLYLLVVLVSWKNMITLVTYNSIKAHYSYFTYISKTFSELKINKHLFYLHCQLTLIVIYKISLRRRGVYWFTLVCLFFCPAVFIFARNRNFFHFSQQLFIAGAWNLSTLFV